MSRWTPFARAFTVNADDNCGTGAGGFKSGNTCGAGGSGSSARPGRAASAGRRAPAPPPRKPPEVAEMEKTAAGMNLASDTTDAPVTTFHLPGQKGVPTSADVARLFKIPRGTHISVEDADAWSDAHAFVHGEGSAEGSEAKAARFSNALKKLSQPQAFKVGDPDGSRFHFYWIGRTKDGWAGFHAPATFS